MVSEKLVNELYENGNVRDYVQNKCPHDQGIRLSYKQLNNLEMQQNCCVSDYYKGLDNEERDKECIKCWLMTHVGGYVLDRVRDGFV